MSKVIAQLEVDKYTLLELDSTLPLKKYNKIAIEGKEYNTEIVYDLQNNIAVLAKGDFVGKEVSFV